MKKLFFTLTIGFSISTFYAQKSSPVIGDVTTLIDLLKKDYNTVNPDNWDEELNTDRGKVIAIFKSYLEDKNRLKPLGPLQQPKDLKTKYDAYIAAKEKLNAFSKMSISVSISNLKIDDKSYPIKVDDQFNNVASKFTEFEGSLKDKKKEYFNEKLESDNVEFENLEYAYLNNNYLKNLIVDFRDKFKAVYDKHTDMYAEKNSYSSIQKSIPFIGGDLAFETLIDGLSRFLAKRIKEELTIHAIDKIKKYLENPTAENYCNELLVLLPVTTNYLKSFESNQLMNFTDEMKQYIEQDLNNLLTNAINLKNTPRLKTYIQNNPDLEFAFEGLEIIPQLSKIKSPIDYFDMLENSRSLTRWSNNPADRTRYNIAQSFKLASMIAYSMTVIDNGETKFASVDLISNYGNEINFYYLYFGFLHQQNIKYFNIGFMNNAVPEPIPLKIDNMMNTIDFRYGEITSSTPTLQFLKSNLTTISTNAEKIYNQGLSIKKKKKNNEEVKYEEIYSFIDDFISFAEEVVKTSDLMMDTRFKFYSNYNLLTGNYDAINVHNDFDLETKLSPYFNVSRLANNMMLDLHQKKYTNAIVKAIEIPLNFRKNNFNEYENKNFTEDLLNFSNQIENTATLMSLSKIFNTEEFDKLSKSNKIKTLKSINTNFHVLHIKLFSNGNLTYFKPKFKSLIISIDALPNKTSVDLKSIEQNIENLKAVLTSHPNEKQELMNLSGISKLNITLELLKKLKQNNVDIGYHSSIISIVDSNLDKIFDEKLYLTRSSSVIDYDSTMKAIIKEFAPQFLNENSKIKDQMAIKVIHFANEMASAKDAEEVEKAIEAFALPVGSSSLKENAYHYFSVNAYPGIILGREFAQDQVDATSFGFTAPVGLYGQISSWGKGESLGIFIPIIDIGAPVRLRIDSNNENKTLPDFNFNDIFSPGFYFTYGFGKKLPLAINVGGQYGPKLRDVEDTENLGSVKTVDSYRINISAVIDIPLLTISGKYKN